MIPIPDINRPITYKTGLMQMPFFRILGQLCNLSLLVGTGSPEGVVRARQTRLYMDDSGSAGSILYIKKVDAIAGDHTKGWVLV